MNTVGRSIKSLRKEKDISQEMLAEHLGYTRQAVSQWETGRTQPDLDTLKAIAEFFKVDILELIYGSDKKANDKRNTRKNWRAFIIYGVLTVVLILIQLILIPHIKLIVRRTYDALPMWLNIYAGLPVTYAITTLFVMRGSTLVWDFRIGNTKVRRLVLIVSIAFLLIYFLTAVLPFFWGGGIFTLIYKASWQTASNPALFILPVVGLHLGWKGRSNAKDIQIK